MLTMHIAAIKTDDGYRPSIMVQGLKGRMVGSCVAKHRIFAERSAAILAAYDSALTACATMPNALRLADTAFPRYVDAVIFQSA